MKDDESIEDLRTREERYEDLQVEWDKSYWSQVGPLLIMGASLFITGVICGYVFTKILAL